MAKLVTEVIAPRLEELSRKTGLIIRPVDSAAVNNLFTKLGKYDIQERAETFAYLRRALNESRTSLGSEPAYLNE